MNSRIFKAGVLTVTGSLVCSLIVESAINENHQKEKIISDSPYIMPYDHSPHTHQESSKKIPYSRIQNPASSASSATPSLEEGVCNIVEINLEQNIAFYTPIELSSVTEKAASVKSNRLPAKMFPSPKYSLDKHSINTGRKFVCFNRELFQHRRR